LDNSRKAKEEKSFSVQNYLKETEGRELKKYILVEPRAREKDIYRVKKPRERGKEVGWTGEGREVQHKRVQNLRHLQSYDDVPRGLSDGPGRKGIKIVIGEEGKSSGQCK